MTTSTIPTAATVGATTSGSNAATTTGTSNTSLPSSQATNQLLDSNFSDFLQLLTTQLQNQDPTNPADTNQLTQQIATLSQVEQQIATNNTLQQQLTAMQQEVTQQTAMSTNLQQLLGAFGSTQYSASASYIGKEVDATGNSISLQSGAGLLAYNLPSTASNVTVSIQNSSGQTVFSAAGPTISGRNEVVWDGSTTAGTTAPDGVYTFTVKATDASGNVVTPTTYTTGIVQSADSSGGAISLSLGNGLSVPIGNVISTRDAVASSTNTSSNTTSSTNTSSNTNGSSS